MVEFKYGPITAVAACCCIMALSVLSGCTRIREAERFTYRVPIHVDTSQLRLDGYYYHVFETNPDKVIKPLILWQDGTAAVFYNFSASINTRTGQIYSYADSFTPAFKHFEKIARQMPKGQTRFFEWGAFRVEEDSIHIQDVGQVAPGGAVGLYGVSYYDGIVLSDTTFVIERINFAGVEKGKRDIRDVEWKYRFRPLGKTGLDTKPDSSNWLKERFK